MATREELREALDEYVAQATKSERVLRALRKWNCIIYFETTDVDAKFTITIKNGQVTVFDGSPEPPDLAVRGSSEDLANIFWGDESPGSNSMQRAIKVQGSQENVMRLDAIVMMIYLGG